MWQRRPMASTWAELTRPVLRPGLHVLRRDDRHLQLGLDPPDRLVLDDRPGLHRALTHLDEPPPATLVPVVDHLVDRGWVVEGAGSARSLRPALVATSVDPGLEGTVARACAEAGLERVATASIHLIATQGEPRRGRGDALVRDDVPHVWLAVLPHRARIGPFVEPGRSACLRCVDAHLGDRDPRRATALHQVEGRAEVAADPLLAQIAVAWAVRDVVRRLDGLPPALASATLTVTDDLQVSRHDWLRHPHCGCAWGSYASAGS